MHIRHISVYPGNSYMHVDLGDSSINIALPKEVINSVVSMCSAEAARFMSNLNVSGLDILDESLRHMNKPVQASLFDPE